MDQPQGVFFAPRVGKEKNHISQHKAARSFSPRSGSAGARCASGGPRVVGRPTVRCVRATADRRRQAAERPGRRRPNTKKHNLIEGVALKDTQRRGERGEQEAREAQRGAAAEAQQRRRSGLFAPGGPCRGRSPRRRARERTRTRPSEQSPSASAAGVAPRGTLLPFPVKCTSSVAGATSTKEEAARTTHGVRTRKFWSGMGVLSLVTFLLRWGSGGARGRWT